jgi:YfiH family protein
MQANETQAIETNLGYLLETPELVVLFGGIKANLVNLQASFPSFGFVRVKQTHSDIVIETREVDDDYKTEGDAHVTDLSRAALCIATADCVPLFVFDQRRKTIAGVHAGWRGVANQIIPKTLQKMVAMGSAISDVQIFIGPHIQKKSFEVQNDVRDQLLSTVSLTKASASETMVSALSEHKSLVDINLITHQQLHLAGVREENIFDLHLDTFSDPRFHSYRRDHAQAGRQLSFICRK